MVSGGFDLRLTLQIRSGQVFIGLISNPAPVFCIWMFEGVASQHAAFADARLASSDKSPHLHLSNLLLLLASIRRSAFLDY